MENELQLVEDQRGGALPAVQEKTYGGTPADLVRYAMDTGADLDRIERLMEMQFKWEAREAEKAFAVGMASFKEVAPKIYKDTHVNFKTNAGVTDYDHASLGLSCDIIVEALAKFGFSHRWVTKQPDGKVEVTCIITHRLGHRESNSLISAPDKSGGKNDIQAIISARTYLERHTLFDAVGLAPLDAPNDDGRYAEPEPKPEPTRAKPIIGAARFASALAKVRAKEYPAANVRKNFELSVDQETALADAEKEAAQ